YCTERVIEHTVADDAGAMIRDGIKTLVKQGTCSEKRWPYVIARFAVKPSAACYREAADHQVTAYARLQTLVAMRACLADGYPFVFGFTVYESFESERVAATGTVPMPRHREKVLGGHAVLAVGYDDVKRRFLVRNSWGTGWGMNGYFTMPYDYLASRDLSDDFWAIRRQEGFKPEPGALLGHGRPAFATRRRTRASRPTIGVRRRRSRLPTVGDPRSTSSASSVRSRSSRTRS